MKHKLIIECLNDGIAHCSCGHWHYRRTGETNKQDIQNWHYLHVLEELRHFRAKQLTK